MVKAGVQNFCLPPFVYVFITLWRLYVCVLFLCVVITIFKVPSQPGHCWKNILISVSLFTWLNNGNTVDMCL